jgi:type II secretory pathway component PulF
VKVVYEGFDLTGKPVTGCVDVAAVADAADQLRRQGVLATSVFERDGAVNGRAPAVKSARRTGRRANGRDLVAFFRQLSILVATHTPVVQALEAIERQTPAGPWCDVIIDMRKRVEEGATFAAAMAAHEDHFDAVAQSMVAAGETGGRMDVMLQGLANLTRQQYHVKRSITGAMVYPAALILVSLGALVVTLFFVLPQFQGLFDTLQVPLPPTTRALMMVANGAKGYWWAVLAGMGGLVALGNWVRHSPEARGAIDRALVHAPKIGPIVRCFATARIARVLGVLLEARIPMLDALQLVRRGTTNACYSKLLEDAETAVSRGEGLAEVLLRSKLVVPSICEALSSGERSGDIGGVLVQVAAFLEEDNEVVVKSLMSIIEPAILTFLGLIVGFVAVSMFLPLFDITALGGGGGGGGGAQ